MSESVDKAADWVYRGVWSVLANCFVVPTKPPTLPTGDSEDVISFHPSRRYVSYLKLYFWIALVVIDLAILVAWIVLTTFQPLLGAILAIPALIIAIVPDIVAYIAIHLRYDTMWYIMSDRSLRCRRGIWQIVEHTISFENVQNVSVRRGPVQQLFGISSIVVETAGASEGETDNAFTVGNKAILEGIENPEEIRESIMQRVMASRSAGIGDEPTRHHQGWTSEQLELLRDIRMLISNA